MNPPHLSVVIVVLAIAIPANMAATDRSITQPHPTVLPRPIPLPTIFPCPYYTTRTNANGVTERVFLPCRTPKPCIWPYPPIVTTHAALTSRLSLYPGPCCDILYRQLSEKSTVPYPLPYPCKFTPLPLPTRKPECAPCSSGRECLQGKCWGSPLKCTGGDYHGLLRCGFKKECDKCNSGLQCATMKCWNRKCVFNTDESKARCFPH